jgi:hypothetical protein
MNPSRREILMAGAGLAVLGNSVGAAAACSSDSRVPGSLAAYQPWCS